ncbi:MAG: hypothetical protein RLZ93_505, partial [Bacteroidota bacterium]
MLTRVVKLHFAEAHLEAFLAHF